jgi:hypothetical protein
MGREQGMIMTQKEVTTLVKVESFTNARRFRLHRHTSVGCTAAYMLSLTLVDTWYL